MRSKSKTNKIASILLAATLLVGAAVPMEAHAAKHWDMRDIEEGTILLPGDILNTVSCSDWTKVDFGAITDVYGQEWGTLPTGVEPLHTYEKVAEQFGSLIPEGTKFVGWMVVRIEDYCDRENCPSENEGPHGANAIILKAVYESIDAPGTGVQATVKEETAAEKAAREWKTSDNNPKNYLTELKASDGTVTVSGLPTKNNAADGAKIIVPMPLKEAETAFEKSKSEYQIVVKIDKSNCGEELKKLLQAEAQKQGATLSTIYDIKAEERAKKDYTYIRDITNVANEITYMISLPADLTKAAGEGKTVSLLHYKEDGTVEVLQDTDLEKGTITVKTKNPSGVFAFIVK